MANRTRTVARVAIAAVTMAMLVGGVPSPVASAATSGTVLHVAITDNGLYVDGPTTFPAGRVTLFVDAAGKDRGAEIIGLALGYSFHDFRADLRVAFSNLFGPHGNKKKGLRALNHAIDNTSSYGGLYAHDGHERHGKMLLDVPGDRYVLFDDSGNLPKRAVPLTVTAPVGPQTLPATNARVVAHTNRRFHGSKVLPAHGNITFINKSTESPHFLELAHVKNGTTRRQVINSFSSNSRPTFVRHGLQDTDVLSSGERMNVHLHLPPGQYAQMCFFPDPKTGQPHALMGMVRMVHLR